jgi:putative transposase
MVNTPEYATKPPGQIVPDLADKGIYLASESTFYRILRKRKLLKHRGRMRPRQSKSPTTHIATSPNQVWTWDITYLPGPVRGIYFKLYLILDIYSRKIVAWEIWDEERAEYAAQLIRQAKARENVKGALVLHSDNGSPMKAATFQATLVKLGITSSYSRPRVSNDNPYSEAGFRTIKYRPDYPTKGFSDISAARAWISTFVTWYHEKHRHSGIGFVTPLERHNGLAEAIQAKRLVLYQAARQKHPERWTRNTRNWHSPPVVALNPEKGEISGVLVKNDT